MFVRDASQSSPPAMQHRRRRIFPCEVPRPLGRSQKDPTVDRLNIRKCPFDSLKVKATAIACSRRNHHCKYPEFQSSLLRGRIS